MYISPDMLRDSGLNELLTHTHLEQDVVDDIRRVAYIMPTAQEYVVEAHADAAIHLLLDKALMAFCLKSHNIICKANSDELSDSQCIGLLEGLEIFLRDIKILDGSLKRRPLKDDLKSFFSYAVQDHNFNDVDQAKILEASKILFTHCVGAENLVSDQAREDFVVSRSNITRNVNAYESAIDQFIEVNKLTDIEQRDIHEFQKQISMWRDGMIKQFPEIPTLIEGFPKPHKSLPRELGDHPILEQVHAISKNLSRANISDEWPSEYRGVELLESGQKSTTRIINKLAKKKAQNKKERLPSDLSDLTRIRFVGDMRDIPQFQRYAMDMFLSDGAEITKYKDMYMSSYGYNNAKFGVKLGEEHGGIMAESQALLPKQQLAYMDSHQVYAYMEDNLRLAKQNIKLANENPESNDLNEKLVYDAIAGYNKLIRVLNPKGDSAFASLIKEYASARRDSDNNINNDNIYYKDIINLDSVDISSLNAGDHQTPQKHAIMEHTIDELWKTAGDWRLLSHFVAARKAGLDSSGVEAATVRAIYDDMQQDDKSQMNRGAVERLLPQLNQLINIEDDVVRPNDGHYTAAEMQEAKLALSEGRQMAEEFGKEEFEQPTRESIAR